METFLIRVWVAPDALEGVPDAPLRGLAQHVRSGLATAFAGGEQLCEWLQEVAEERADHAVPAPEDTGAERPG
jgi:hypothetical protein